MTKLRSVHNTEALIQALNKFYPLISAFMQSEVDKGRNGKKLDPLQVAVNQYMVRNMLNIKALIPLMEIYKTQRGMIFPIGLLLRSIYSDFISLCYLLTFCENDRIVTESFKNELNLFDRDALSAFIEMMKLEAEYGTYFPTPPPNFEGKESTERKINNLKTVTYKRFFDDQGNWKKVTAFRSTSNKELFDKYSTPINKPENFVTEKYKWNRLEKTESFKKYVLVFNGYKIFSQFQHFSLLSSQLFSEEQDDFLYHHFLTAIDSIFIVSDLHVQIMDSPQSPILVELRKIKNEVDLKFIG